MNAQRQEESFYLCFDNQLSDHEVPEDQEHAMKSVDASKWVQLIKEELYSYQHNNSWTLMDKTPDMSVIDANGSFASKKNPLVLVSSLGFVR